MKTLGEKIKDARKLLGFRQADMAEKVGMVTRDLSLIENGKRHRIPEKLLLFLKESGIDMSSLFDPGLKAQFMSDEYVFDQLLDDMNNALKKYVHRQTTFSNKETQELSSQIIHLTNKLRNQDVIIKKLIEKVDKSLIAEYDDFDRMEQTTGS